MGLNEPVTQTIRGSMIKMLDRKARTDIIFCTFSFVENSIKHGNVDDFVEYPAARMFTKDQYYVTC